MKNSVKRIIGYLLCLVLVVSALYIPMGFSVSAATPNYYYVKCGGTGDGRSYGNPAPSVLSVSNTIAEDGLSAGDIADISIIGGDNVPAESATSWTGTLNTTPWKVASDTTAARQLSCNVVIHSYNNVMVILSYSSEAGDTANCELFAPTEFHDIKFLRTSGSNTPTTGFVCNGYSLNFGTECAFRYIDSNKVSVAYAPKIIMTKSTNNEADVELPQNISFTSAAEDNGYMFIASDSYSNKAHNEDVNIVLNHANIGSGKNPFRLVFGGSSSTAATHTFEKNLNIDIRSATKVGFQGHRRTGALDHSSSNQTITVEGALQIIKNTTTVFWDLGSGGLDSTGTDAYRAITNINSFDSDTIDNIRVVTIAAADREKIDFTETAGVFSVAEGYTAVATNNADASDTVKSSGGTLTLPAGDWTISFANYYVQYGGAGDGRTVGNPARSIRAVTNSINTDGYAAGDNVNIYVLESSGTVTDNGDSTYSHSMTPWWVSGSDKDVVNHTATLIIQGYNGSQWLAYASIVDENIILGGPTVFKNIKLFTTGATDSRTHIYALGKDLTFESGTEFYERAKNATTVQRFYTPRFGLTRTTVTNSSNAATSKQTITYKAGISDKGALFIPTNNRDNQYSAEDTNIVIDNASIGSNGAFRLVFGGTNSQNSDKHTFRKNLNIDIRSAANIGFQGHVNNSFLQTNSSKQTVQVNGGLQIITNTTTKYHNIGVQDNISAYAAITSINSIVSTGGIWVLTVPAADREKIDFTETKGEFSVAEGYTAVATSTSATVTSSNNLLTLPAGDWTISLTKTYNGHSLVLADTIGVEFVMDLSLLTEEEKATSYMTFDITNAAIDMAFNYADTRDVDGKRGFICYLSPVQLAETITPTLHYTQSGVEKTIVGEAYSATDYIDWARENENNETIRRLANAIGNYCYYSQKHFTSKTFTSLGIKYRTVDYYSSVYNSKATALSTAGKIIDKGNADGSVAFTLNFDSTTSILLKFNTGNVTFSSVTVGGNDFTARKNAYSNNQCILYLLHIPISQLGDTISVSGKLNTTTDYTIDVSGISYVYAALSSGTATASIKNATCALQDYYTAAVAYADYLAS